VNVIRASAGAMLLAERGTLRRLTQDVNDSVNEAAAQASERRKRTAMLLLILSASQTMAGKARQTILAGRQATRAVAIGRLTRELAVAGVAGAALANFGNGQVRAADDGAYAQSSADALAVAWRGLALVAVSKAARLELNPTAAVRQTAKLMVPRIARTAATENAQAYNDEHRAALVDAVEYDRAYRGGAFWDEVQAGVVRQWSALLDARVCRVCDGLDGTTAEVGEYFEGGVEPGFVHIKCRCIDVIVTRAEAERKAA
jgi:hypothetical protein